MEKRGQVTIFVIVALVVVASIASYFIIRSIIDQDSSSGEFSDVFSYYEECIGQYAKTGISIAGSKGGFIEDLDYEPGSEYAPFGNQLNLQGSLVPYWYTIKGNGISNENVPTLESIQNQLNGYIGERLSGCSFDIYRLQGLDISLDNAVVQTSINQESVSVKVRSTLTVVSDNSSAQRTDFDLDVPTKFGSLFSQAKEIYEYQQNNLFLENYSYDVLRLYAPVDGVEIQCSPETWVIQDVFENLQSGLSQNLATIKFDGDYHVKSSLDDDRYYYVDVNTRDVDSAQVLYDPSWPSRFEVYGNEGSLLVARPVGDGQGLNSLGFCYVPYHFVYDMMFSTVIRLSSQEDIFQFPVVVVIDKNVPRKAYQSSISIDYGDSSSLCEASTQQVSVQVRDSDGAVANANVRYKCFDQTCPVGETNGNGIVSGNIPGCLNGFIEVDSEGHSSGSFVFSSHNTSNALVYIEKEYPINVSLLVDGLNSNNLAFISFAGDKLSRQAVIPDSPTIGLVQGFYNVTVYQYGNTSIRIPASSSQQCVEAPAGGLAGLFGSTREQCYDISIPATTIESALTAGGKGEIYLTKELLEQGRFSISVQSLPKPNSIDSLQTNYALFETQGVDVIYE